MIEIDDKLVSLDVFDQKFQCDIQACKGQCCVDGDSGAPLEDDEVRTIEKVYPKVKPFMRSEGIQAIKQQDLYVVDYDGDKVTPLVNERECAYAIFEDGIAMCAFEKAFNEGVIKFQKPISCHLYPIRISKLKNHSALNYDVWDVCHSARKCGKRNKTAVYEFLKQPLTRMYGKEWYKELKLVATELEKQKSDI